MAPPSGRLTSHEAFRRAVQDFAGDVARALGALGEGQTPQMLVLLEDDAGFVRPMGRGQVLRSGDEDVLTLQSRFKVTRDGSESYLRVEESQVRVLPVGGRRPVFRYEYERSKEARSQPAAHLQIHGTHSELVAMMHSAGRQGSRSSEVQGVPDITDLHFPVGGTRFRPCLEDVLEFLVHEFRLDVGHDRGTALAVLRQGRVRWREQQLRAAVRDAPWVAVEVLQELGVLEAEGQLARVVPETWSRL